MKTITGEIVIDEIIENTRNPRVITDLQLAKLKKSLSEFPEMMKIRPLVINDENVLLGGNMRLRALKELGYEVVPFIRVSGLTTAQEDEFVIKNNLHYGEWEWGALVDAFDLTSLSEWGISIPASVFDDDEEPDLQFEPVTRTLVQMKFDFDVEEYARIVDKLGAVERREGLENFTEIIIWLIEKYYEKSTS